MNKSIWLVKGGTTLGSRCGIGSVDFFLRVQTITRDLIWPGDDVNPSRHSRWGWVQGVDQRKTTITTNYVIQTDV